MWWNGKELSNLLGLLYEGLACPERWEHFLAEVARSFACDKAAIALVGRGKQKPVMKLQTGLQEDAMRDYNAHYGARNPVVPHVVRAARANGSWHGLARAVVGEREYKKSEYYDGWGRKHGVFHTVVGVASDDCENLASLSVVRSETAEPLSKDAVDLMGLLVPHLRRAFQIQQMLEGLRGQAVGSANALDRLDAAVIGVDGTSRVVGMNRRAESLLKGKKSVALKGRTLVAADPSQSARLEKLVKRAALTGAGRATHSGDAMLLHEHKNGSEPLSVSVMPFHSSHLLTEESPCALVFINDPADRPASRSTVLSALYGLTPTECRLADLLLELSELRLVADRMGVAMNTARFTLKNVFHKTGTHRQSQLIRLLMSLPGESRTEIRHD